MPSRKVVPIIGGGPAGMSCALWLHNYGLRPVIIEQEAVLGGMAERNPYPNPWLLGWPGAMAREQAHAFARHVGQAGIEVWFNARPQRIVQEGDGAFAFDIMGDEVPHSISCRTLVIATGTQFRGAEWLDRVANARRFVTKGRVHVGPTAIGERDAQLGEHVALIGGGDNAFDIAHILLRKGIRVTIVMRSKDPQAQPRLVAHLQSYIRNGRAEVIAGRNVAALSDSGGRIALRLDDGRMFDTDHVVLLFGYRPNTHEPWLTELPLQQNADGHLTVDGNMETSCSGHLRGRRRFKSGASMRRHRDRQRHHGGARDPAAARLVLD